MKKSTAALRGTASILALLMPISATAANLTFKYDSIINKSLGISTTAKAAASEENIYWKNDYGYDANALVDVNYDAAAANIEIAEEGITLLRNENNALPLAEGSKITVFGNAAINSNIFTESRASYLTTSTLLSSLEQQFGAANINETLCNDVYSQLGKTDISNVVEADVATISSKASSWSNYGDVALVVLGRTGSEGNDLYQYSASDTYEDGSPRRMLDLSTNEAAMMQYLQQQKEAGAFKKIVVIVASEFPMELGFLSEYDVDAALLTGTCGAFGCTAIAEILAGTVNPSGHVVDTYAANSVSAPAVLYAGQEGTREWTNADEVNAYVQKEADIANDQIDFYNIYAEGIYVGYKYYETRYEDTVMGTGNANGAAGATEGETWNYSDEMVYPFGYGLSYTTFDQTLDSVEYDEASNSYNVKVTVTNSGSTAGKSVVEVYAQTPYGDYEKTNRVEKAAVNLMGYGKTSLLDSGASETVTVNVPRYFLASYDENAAKTYILSQGDYYFAIGSDAHDALNNILAAKGYTTDNGMTAAGDAAKTYTWTQDALDTTTYSASPYTGYEVTNQFDDADLNYYGYDFTYLSRSDWEGTYPVEAYAIEANEAIYSTLSNYDYETPADAPDVSSFTQEAENGLQLIDMMDVAADDDEAWDKFLDQMSVEEMANLMTDSEDAQLVADLGIPGNRRIDDDTNPGGQFTWVSHPLTARTWNVDLHNTRGYFEGIIASLNDYDEIWFGSGNLHRTPYNGRTGQYFSEDATISYWAGYYEAQGVQSVGTICCVKHFTTNDQETHRQGLTTFTNEQALREIYLRAFEGAFQGGALSTMTALNRIGTRLCKNNYALITTVLRDEWGFDGHVTSDGYVDLAYFNNTLEELVAGMDYSCIDTSGANAPRVISAVKDGDGYILQAIRQAAKRNLYVMLHTTSMNGLGGESSIMVIVPTWEKALMAVNVALTGAFVVVAVLAVVSYLKKKQTVVKKEN